MPLLAVVADATTTAATTGTSFPSHGFVAVSRVLTWFCLSCSGGGGRDYDRRDDRGGGYDDRRDDRRGGYDDRR